MEHGATGLLSQLKKKLEKIVKKYWQTKLTKDIDTCQSKSGIINLDFLMAKNWTSYQE